MYSMESETRYSNSLENKENHNIPKFYFEDTDSKESTPEFSLTIDTDGEHGNVSQTNNNNDIDDQYTQGCRPPERQSLDDEPSHCFTVNGSVKIHRDQHPDVNETMPDIGSIPSLKLPRSGSLTNVTTGGLAPTSGLPSRSSSCRRRKSRVAELQQEALLNRPSSLIDLNKKQRPQSMVTHSNSDSDLYRVRSFKVTKKGQLINQGDLLRSWSKDSITSTCSLDSDVCENVKIFRSPRKTGDTRIGVIPDGVLEEPDIHKVLVLGTDGVGKSAMMQQFTTSEDTASKDDGEMSAREREVTVLLDGKESIIKFYELTAHGAPEENAADGYVVVYSITDRLSFYSVIDIIHRLRDEERRDAAIIIAGNKSDIVRQRQVTEEEGKSIAKRYKSKFIETSTYLNHKVDVLLVGILAQIRKHQSKIKKTMDQKEEPETIACTGTKKKANILRKLFGRTKRFKSVDNVLK